MADVTSLGRLVGCPADVFASRHWGRVHLLSRADRLPGGFDDLFTADDVDELLSRRGVRLPYVRMVKQGVELDPAQFTRSGGVGSPTTDQVADDMVLVAMNEGASLVIDGLHRLWGPLTEFTARLSAELGHPVRSNLHVTPPHARGLAPHHDNHDVFVVQIAGRKRWRLLEPAVEAPLFGGAASDEAVRARIADEPVLDTILGPGDVLYVPRGVVHHAATEDETSIHVTIGVPPLTRYDLVAHCLDLMRDDAALRAALPMGVALDDPAVLAAELDTTLELLRARLGTVTAPAAAGHITATLIERTRPEPIGPMRQLALARGLGDTTRLRARTGVRTRRAVSEDGIRLTRGARFISFPPLVGPALDVAMGGTVFTPAELPGLGPEDRIAFTKRLIVEGLVVAAGIPS